MEPHRAFWLAFATAWGFAAAFGAMLFLGRGFSAIVNYWTAA